MVVRLTLAIVSFTAFSTSALGEDFQDDVRSKALGGFMRILESTRPSSELPAKEIARELVLAYFGKDNAQAESRLGDSLAGLAKSRAIKSSQRADPATFPKLQSADMQMLSLYVNKFELIAEIESIVDHCADRPGLTNEILGGIAKDPNGPKIDVTKDLIPHLGNTWIVCNETAKPGFRWFVAIKLNDQEAVADVVSRFCRNEPNVKVTAKNTYVAELGWAATVVDRWLVFGTDTLVQDVRPRMGDTE
tara:strand:+ start:720 stop:1463 length:744 start_codon:yes stop_codon:yes gene_type:complete